MSELEIGRTLLLWFWALGLAGIEIEIEGGYGWAERLPTWWLRRGLVGRIYGVAMGHRPLTGYHVFAFTIPLLILHLPFVLRRRLDLRRRARHDRARTSCSRSSGITSGSCSTPPTPCPVQARQRVVVRGAVDRALPARLLLRASGSRSRSPGSRASSPATPSCSGGTCGCSPAARC